MAKFKNFLESINGKLEKTDYVCSECFSQYDDDRDDALNVKELSQLLDGLLLSDTCPATGDISERIFDLLDEDKDGKICQEDFRRCGYYWLKQILGLETQPDEVVNLPDRTVPSKKQDDVVNVSGRRTLYAVIAILALLLVAAAVSFTLLHLKNC